MLWDNHMKEQTSFSILRKTSVLKFLKLSFGHVMNKFHFKQKDYLKMKINYHIV